MILLQVMEKYINDVIRPRIQGDGGEIEFVSFEENELRVVFRGECSKCLILDRCVSWIRDEIMREFGADVKIVYERHKPFFWDK